MTSFTSDNYSGVAPEILNAIIQANHGHQTAYGGDIYTEEAVELIKQTFGRDCIPYFVYNGTAANSVGLHAVLRSHHAILCADTAHINTQEVGAVTHLTGCPCFLIPHHHGKIDPTGVRNIYEKAIQRGPHGNLPKALSISQSTEFGTVYTREELKALGSLCKELGLIFHMDGCRLPNAAVYLNLPLAAITQEIGVDILSFGGTKNGLMFGEAVIFFNSDLATEFELIRKQDLQLHSKMRFLSAQFIPYLKNSLWSRYATQANQMCRRLADGLFKLSTIKQAYPVETNQIFAYFPETMIECMQKIYPFYLWDKQKNLVRLVTSFDTNEEDVEAFIRLAETHHNLLISPKDVM